MSKLLLASRGSLIISGYLRLPEGYIHFHVEGMNCLDHEALARDSALGLRLDSAIVRHLA